MVNSLKTVVQPWPERPCKADWSIGSIKRQNFPTFQ